MDKYWESMTTSQAKHIEEYEDQGIFEILQDRRKKPQAKYDYRIERLRGRGVHLIIIYVGKLEMNNKSD